MTANQLAYAALQESTRHNLAGEAETGRHNVESERLESKAQDITEKLGLLQDERERQKIQYDKDYKEYSLKLAQAAQDEKEWYDWKLSTLKEAELNNIKAYNDEVNRLKGQELDISKQMAENDRMYKEAWKEVQYLNADLQNKRIEYEATLQREEMENKYKIQSSINALTQWRDTANYILSMESTSQKWSDLRNAQKELQMQIEKQDQVIKNLKADTGLKHSQSFKNYFGTIMDAINETAANGFKAFDMFLGGKKYGTAKKAAEALFTD